MANNSSHERHCLFDFGPLAGEYDRWYSTREGRLHDHTQKQDVLRILSPSRPGDRMLEVGGGTGHWSSFFAGCGFKVVSVDISEDMVRVARDRTLPRCRFLVADACRLPFADRSFDAAAIMATLEFVSDRTRALKEMFRCVKPGRSVLIGTLNRLAPINQRRLAEGKQPYASGRLFTPGELYESLAPFGRVRVVAFSVGSEAEGMRAPIPVVDRLSLAEKEMTGAFIVAEVQT